MQWSLLGIIKSSFPGALLEKKGGKMAPGVIQFHVLHGVFELLSPEACSSWWAGKLRKEKSRSEPQVHDTWGTSLPGLPF